MHEHHFTAPDHAAADHTDDDAIGGDHWGMFAETMDLTIEGHRLIAQEIVYEGKLLWRAGMAWSRDIIGTMFRRRSSPPV